MRGGQSYRAPASATRDLRLHKLAPPADVTNAELFPNITEGSAWLASLPVEERERLNKEWGEQS